MQTGDLAQDVDHGGVTTPGAAAPPDAVVSSAAPGAARRKGFRADIDGVRALAIILVVAYHARVAGFSGGFVGVDVFFVISGYLITRNLLNEVSTSGRVALAAFWARRIRRLVPALALLVVVVLAAVMVVQPELEWGPAARSGRAAALYVSNLTFAAESADYFAPDVRSNPFLHTWSLAVEEQFYLVWPLLVGAACLFAGRTRGATARPGGDRRRVLAGVFALTMVASFVLSVAQTRTGSVWAFYGLPSRAWEFAAAGLLAVALERALPGRALRAVAALAGLGAIAAATLLLDDLDPYPGVRALLPVGGTLLLLAAGDGSPEGGFPPLTSLLAWRPVQWLGRVSYSWYLWHWPMIVLTVEALDRDTTGVRCAAAAAALVVAAVAHHLVENPVRFHPRLATSARRTFVMGGAVTTVVVASTFAVAIRGERDIAADEDLQTMEEVRAGARVFVCADLRTSDTGIEYCEDGDTDSGTSVMLIGDSHARHWAPAFAAAAKEEGIRLLIRAKGRCPSMDIAVAQEGTRVEDPACLEFRDETRRLLDELRPDAVVISNSNSYFGGLLPDPDGSTRGGRERWADAYRAQLESLRAQGYRLGAVVDTPRPPFDVIDCVAERGEARCAFALDQAMAAKRPFMEAEVAVERSLGDIAVLDVNDELCPEGTCPVVVDGVFVYPDDDHLNAGYAPELVPDVSAFFRDLVG